MPPLKSYDSDLPYSYAPGVFPALELMKNAPRRARRLLLSERAQGEGVEKLRRLCREHGARGNRRQGAFAHQRQAELFRRRGV